VIDMDTRLRVGRAVCKREEESALELMQILQQAHPHAPPALATDAKGGYAEAMIQTWGKVPPYSGQGRPAKHKQPGADWKYLQVQKIRSGSRLLEVRTRVVWGDPEEVEALLGRHTAYIERTQLTSRQMNARLVRKTLSFSKQLRCLRAACAWEDALYNWTRPNRSLRESGEGAQERCDDRTPAMAAGLTQHRWSVQQLLMTVVPPVAIN
jgi:hypothetical protein